MDSGRMDARGGRALSRSRRVRKLVLVVLQNLLVIACLLLTLTVYLRTAEEPSSEKNVHIRFDPIVDITSSGTLRFKGIHSGHRMNLTEEKDMIHISCNGPYVLYIDVCFKSMKNTTATGYLQLRVMGQHTRASSFDALNATSNLACMALHSTVYLRESERASLYLTVHGSFKVKTASVGLSYLLGGQCDF